jgi:hypothetical protein
LGFGEVVERIETMGVERSFMTNTVHLAHSVRESMLR